MENADLYSLKFTREAKQDLIDIPNYIKYTLLNPKAADDLFGNFEKAFKQICTFAESGSPYKKRKGYRKILVNNFLIFYKINKKEKSIEVYRILYAHSNYKKRIR
jgi:addiction module RelE/StbE family toxin